jgi:hypothetical protein
MARAVVRSPLDPLPLGQAAVAEVWGTLPIGVRRNVIKVLMDVTLTARARAGRGFDPESVDINWKR